jgi:hypothetical protein
VVIQGLDMQDRPFPCDGEGIPSQKQQRHEHIQLRASSFLRQDETLQAGTVDHWDCTESACMMPAHHSLLERNPVVRETAFRTMKKRPRAPSSVHQVSAMETSAESACVMPAAHCT